MIPACDGELFDHTILALLTLCAIMMRPSIDGGKLKEVVMRTSEALVLNLADAPTGEAN